MLAVSNPIDGLPITTDLQVAGEEDINAVVAAANTVFQIGTWRSFTRQ